MNHRVLELLKAPKNIQSGDLTLLKEEINSFPYVQNIRALYLYGVHLYDKENYQQVLSTTAAYTTDKKILYHLINGKIQQQQPKPEIKKETEKPAPAENHLKTLYQTKETGFPIKREDAPVAAESEIKEVSPAEVTEKKQDADGRILPPPREEIRHLYINGERNRILFEGEENFLDDDTVETIDLESTLESGSIVTQKIEKKEEPAPVSEEKPHSETASPEIYKVQTIGEIEESVPETADEEEEIHAESEEKQSTDESGIVLQKEEAELDHQNGFKEEAESRPVENASFENVDVQTSEDTGAATTELIEEEKDAEPSEADFHEIKVILDALQEDNTEETADDEAAKPQSDGLESAQPEKTEEFTQETIIEEEKINAESEKEEILDESEISFKETEAFMPEVQIPVDESEEIEKPENSDSDPAPEISEFTPEKVINEDKILSERIEETVKDESEISFKETEAFIPEVEIPVDKSEEIEKPENSDSDPAPEISEFTSEKIINEDEISSERVEETIQNESELSFHGTESFLPEVKIQANEEETINKLPEQNLSKHEDEMRRLIEEVEKKMKEKAASEENKKPEKPENTGHDISFAETRQFEIKPAEPEMPETKEEVKENSAETVAELKEEKEEIQNSKQPAEGQAETRSWKPMSFDSNIPDSLLNKPAETSQPVAEVPKEETVKEEPRDESPEEIEPVSETETEEIPDSENNTPEDAEETAEPTGENEETAQEKTEEEERVMNVSFFGSGWTIPQPEKKKASEKSDDAAEKDEPEVRVEKPSTPKTNVFDSNVPGFINTWQSWLKIDRTEEVAKEKTELKNKVIETFIENNPRISQLKEESSFVIREKGDDISHLMTETLANLYFEQKLYTKAIKAFEILIKKTPEKKKYYEGKIQEIKDFRTKG